MGQCWSDQVQDGERFEIVKHFKEEGDEVFYTKAMNPDVQPEIERLKRITMSDGLGIEDTSRTVVSIAY